MHGSDRITGDDGVEDEEWRPPPRPRCGQIHCGYYPIETEPPMEPTLWACSRGDCRWAIRPYGSTAW